MILIKNKDNYGFTGGNNIGMKFALATLDSDYILLLNNDTVVHENFLTELILTAESDEKIGIVGPKIYYYDYNGRSDVISFTGGDLILWKGDEKRYGYNEVDCGQWDKIMQVDKIEGSCMLINGNVLKKIGFLDEKFFCYWEETDLCFRAKNRGYKIIYSPKSKIWHKVAASSGGTLSSFYIYSITRNKLWFLRKNAPLMILRMYLIYLFLWESWFSFLVFILYHKNIKALFYYSIGIIDGIFGKDIVN